MTQTITSDKLFFCSKTYTHETGLSATFRQWRATSHCHKLHGYALQVKMVFGAVELDQNGWVVDFGCLKGVKAWLAMMFDHVTLVAADDPELPSFHALAEIGVISLNVVPATGCEAFAGLILDYVREWMIEAKLSPRAFLISVEVSEHGGNSAICYDREAHAALSA